MSNNVIPIDFFDVGWDAEEKAIKKLIKKVEDNDENFEATINGFFQANLVRMTNYYGPLHMFLMTKDLITLSSEENDEKPSPDEEKAFNEAIASDVTISLPPLTETFILPPRELLLSLKVGDLVKVIFNQKGRPGERMWVKLTKLDVELYTGVLMSAPLCVDMLIEQEVSFHPLSVIDIVVSESENVIKLVKD